MCDIPIEKLIEHFRRSLQQHDPSRLKTVALVSGSALALAGLAYFRLRIISARINLHGRASSSKDEPTSSMRQGLACGESRRSAGDGKSLLAVNEGRSEQLRSARCPICDPMASEAAGYPDCHQTRNCSESCMNTHRRIQQASRAELHQSIDQAVLSYLFSSPNQALDKCDAALGRSCLGFSTDVNSSALLTQPLLLDLRGSIHARRGEPAKARDTFLSALSRLRESIAQHRADYSSETDDLPAMNTRWYLLQASAFSHSQLERIEAQVILRMRTAELKGNDNKAEAAAFVVKACQAASVRKDDTLCAISLPVQLKVAATSSRYDTFRRTRPGSTF